MMVSNVIRANRSLQNALLVAVGDKKRDVFVYMRRMRCGPGPNSQLADTGALRPVQAPPGNSVYGPGGGSLPTGSQFA